MQDDGEDMLQAISARRHHMRAIRYAFIYFSITVTAFMMLNGSESCWESINVNPHNHDLAMRDRCLDAWFWEWKALTAMQVITFILAFGIKSESKGLRSVKICIIVCSLLILSYTAFYWNVMSHLPS